MTHESHPVMQTRSCNIEHDAHSSSSALNKLLRVSMTLFLCTTTYKECCESNSLRVLSLSTRAQQDGRRAIVGAQGRAASREQHQQQCSTLPQHTALMARSSSGWAL